MKSCGVMTRDPEACRTDDRLDRLVERMENRRIRRIPVVDGDGRVVGIVTQSDIAGRARVPLMAAALVREIARPRAIHA